MGSHEMVEPCPSGGLAPFVQPEAGYHAREVWPPDSGHEARLRGRRHNAGGGAHDVGETTDHRDRLPVAVATAQGPDPTGMGVDEGCGDRRSWGEAKLARGRAGQSAS